MFGNEIGRGGRGDGGANDVGHPSRSGICGGAMSVGASASASGMGSGGMIGAANKSDQSEVMTLSTWV